MNQITQSTLFRWLWLSLLVVIVDQTSKSIILERVAAFGSFPMIPFFNVTLVYNHGAAFSLLSERNGWQRWFFIVTALAICGFLLHWLKTAKKQETLVGVGISLVLGGAIGNVIDRLSYGYVIDFIDFYVGDWHWYTFNIADIAICIGVGMLCIDTLWSARIKSVGSASDKYSQFNANTNEHDTEEERGFMQPVRADHFRVGSGSVKRDLRAAQQNLANQGHQELGLKVPRFIDEFKDDHSTKASNLSDGPRHHAEAHPVIAKSARFHNSDENTAPLPDSPPADKELELRYNPSPSNQPGAVPERKTRPDFRPPGV